MLKKNILTVCLGTLASLFCINAQVSNGVFVRQETQVLKGGVKSIYRSDIFYNLDNDAVVTHHYYPLEFIKMSNRLGELKLYFPETNTVRLEQNELLSTTNDLLYYFVNNKLTDMGLDKEGFTLSRTSREGEYTRTFWESQAGTKGIINHITIVYKDMLPIYAEYLDAGNQVKKKIYYSKYSDYKFFTLPMRITEISFISPSDSMISLSVFKEIKTEGFPENHYFNFKIPDDAKLIR